MAEEVQIAAFEGGSLNVHGTGEKSREAVLALPLNRLLLKVIRVPAEYRDDPIAYATPQMQAMSPFPDDPLTVSYEVVSDDSAEELVVLAAALPENATDDLGDALDEAKLNITRVDALALGRLRMLWGQLNIKGEGERDLTRRVILLPSVDCISVFVLDDDDLCAVRAISHTHDLTREIMLSLLEAEDFNGPMPLAEIILVEDALTDTKPPVGEISFGGDASEAGDTATEDDESKPQKLEISTEQLATLASVRTLNVPDDSVRGVVERSLDPSTFNALPEAWREMLEESRFKTKLRNFLITAGVIWALIMGVLFGVPFVYGFMTDHQKSLSKEHARRYNEVKEMREKVRLVQKYSDHARGALEILKAVSDRLPEGVELNNWSFRRDEGVRFSGEAVDAPSVYTLKDRLLETKLEGADGSEEPLFKEVLLTGPSAGRGGKQRFDIDCKYETEEEE